MNNEAIVPSLDDWEREWTEKAEGGKWKVEKPQPKLLLVDFRSPLDAVARSN